MHELTACTAMLVAQKYALLVVVSRVHTPAHCGEAQACYSVSNAVLPLV
jgi:hypothetical protein